MNVYMVADWDSVTASERTYHMWMTVTAMADWDSLTASARRQHA